MSKKAIVIDGNSLMFRAFYATYKQLEYYKQNNIPYTNALRTMSVMLNNLINSDKYDYAVIAFDHKDGAAARKEKLDGYKANRKKTPEELIPQIDLIKEMSSFIGFNVFCEKGIEADDVVGSVSKKLSSEGVIVHVYSSDKDLLQLVDENINVILIKNGNIDNITNTLINFKNLNSGLEPMQIIDYKSLAGDLSDNIPGVKGVGEKTAIELVKKYGSIENIYNNLEYIESKSVKEKLLKGKNDAFLSKEIATIILNHFDNIDSNNFVRRHKNIDGIRKIITNYNLKSLEKII